MEMSKTSDSAPYSVCTLVRALLCDEIRLLMVIQPIWVWKSCWIAVKQKAETVGSWLILHSLLHCLQCCTLLLRLHFLNVHACWLLLDADWFPSAIMTPFTATGPQHTNMVGLILHGMVLCTTFEFQWLTCMVCLLASVLFIASL